jgi:L-lactate permease
MEVMVLILNAVLYVVALSLSLAVLTPVPETASGRVRAARAALAAGGGLAMSVAITLSFLGDWFESGIAGCVAIVIVSACLWFALSSRFTPKADDEEDGDDGGGGPRKRPDPPAPPEPAGGPAEDLWGDFDRARAGWDREREPSRT